MYLGYSIDYSILCDRIDELYRVVKDERKSDLSEELTRDLQDYLFLLAALDGNISFKDVYIINFILGTAWNGIEVKKYIKANNIYSDKFMNSVPESFKKLLELEEKIGNRQLGDFIFGFYKDVSTLFESSTCEQPNNFSKNYLILLNKYKKEFRG